MLVLKPIVKNWPITVLLTFLTVYSLSNHIDFGDTNLVSYSLPRWMVPVVGMARAAGRLFWPIGYLIIAAAFALTVHKYRERATGLVIAAVVLACVEASGTYAFLQNRVRVPPQLSLNYAGLEQVMSQHKTMLLYPSFWCDPGADGSPKRYTHQQLEFAAARANLDSNSSITARKMKDCSREAGDIAILRPGDLTVSGRRSARIFLASRRFDRALQILRPGP